MSSCWLRFAAPILCLSIGMAQPQKPVHEASASGITLSVVGDSSGLDSYLATLKSAVKQKWIEAWSVNVQTPVRVVLTLHINHSGYLDQMDTEGSGRVPPNLGEMQGAAVNAVEAVFTGLPPDPPRNINQSQILVKAVFVDGTDKPRL